MSAPELPDILKNLGGWKGLEGLDEQMADEAKAAGGKRRQLAEAMARIAGTPDGEMLLEHLLDVTVRRSSVPQAFASGEQPLTFEQLAPRIVWREAQNALAISLITLVDEGLRSTGQPKRRR